MTTSFYSCAISFGWVLARKSSYQCNQASEPRPVGAVALVPSCHYRSYQSNNLCSSAHTSEWQPTVIARSYRSYITHKANPAANIATIPSRVVRIGANCVWRLCPHPGKRRSMRWKRKASPRRASTGKPAPTLNPAAAQPHNASGSSSRRISHHGSPRGPRRELAEKSSGTPRM